MRVQCHAPHLELLPGCGVIDQIHALVVGLGGVGWGGWRSTAGSNLSETVASAPPV